MNAILTPPTDAQYRELLAAKRALMDEQGAGSMLSGDGDGGLVAALPRLIEEYNERHPSAQIAIPYAAVYDYQLTTRLVRKAGDPIPLRRETEAGIVYVLPN